MKETILKIEGMHCENCANRIKNVLEKVDGVNEVEVSLEDKCATVRYENDINTDQLKDKVENLDFEVVGIE